MPLVKRQSGWFWGSQGPFDSKAKALSVARAAYASGYKEANGNAPDLGRFFDESHKNPWDQIKKQDFLR